MEVVLCWKLLSRTGAWHSIRWMLDNSPQRQLAPDDSPPVSGQFAPVSGQFAPSLWTIRPTLNSPHIWEAWICKWIREPNRKSIEASCSKTLLYFVNKKLNFDCIFETWFRTWILNTESIEALCLKALLHFVNKTCMLIPKRKSIEASCSKTLLHFVNRN